MFSATAHQVAKALGKDTLLPVPSLNTADNIEILRILIKKKRKWLFFTRKPHYETTDFHLSDILTEKSQNDPAFENLPTDSHVLTVYNSKTNLSLKGKFGADLTKELLDVQLRTTDSVVVSSQLGSLIKTELSTPKLLFLLEKKKVDLHNLLVQSLKDSSNKSLCIITSVIELENEGKITSEINLEGDAELDSKPLGLEANGEVSENKSKSMTIPKQTSIAFSMLELLVSTKDGAIQLMLSSDEEGGFTTEDLDVTDGPSAQDPESVLSVITTNGKQRDVLISLQQLLEKPSCIQRLLELFREVDLSFNLELSQNYSLEDLHEEFGLGDDPQYWHPFLTCSEFVITEDRVTLPDSDSIMFDVCYLVLTLLHELDDSVISGIAQCLMVSVTTENALPVIKKIIKNKDSNQTLTTDETEILMAVPISSLMTSLNIPVTSDSLDIQVPNDSRLDLQVTYYILNAVLV